MPSFVIPLFTSISEFWKCEASKNLSNVLDEQCTGEEAKSQREEVTCLSPGAGLHLGPEKDGVQCQWITRTYVEKCGLVIIGYGYF